MDCSNERTSYEKYQLDESETTDTPFAFFERWFSQARAVVDEPTAMTLATVNVDLRPTTRVVLMKEADETGITFYTNYASAKGRDLDIHPWAAAQFHWPQLERVIRIEGTVEKIDPADSDAYFASRPYDSRIGAWASHQSEVIPNRAVLLAKAARYAAKFGLNPPRPDHWGGYRLRPDLWEFWQGRPSRLHDRIRYRYVDQRWIKERLSP